MIDARTTRVGHARVRGRADPTTARLRLSSLLAGAELRPPGLPPAAVLCVRRVLDPLPGALQLETMEARPPPEWERAFVETLERALRSAARPAREAVPAAAEAVLFADRAELLACLARDALAGTAWLHWWWRDLGLSPGLGGDPVVAAWLETPEHVPAALQLLAARRDAVRFVAAISERDARALVLRVAEVHGLPELRRAVESAASAAPVDPHAPSPQAGRVPETPWRRLVPETAERPLAPAAELLLALALALRRAPQLVRAPSFAAATRLWLESATARAALERTRATAPAQAAHDETAPEAKSPPSRAPRRPRPVHDAMPRRARVRSAPPVQSEEGEAPPHSARSEAPPTREPVARERTAPPVSQVHTEEPPSVHPSRPRVPADASSPADAAPAQPARAAARTPAAPRKGRRVAPRRAARRAADLPEPSPGPPELVVETSLGGVFYLLNLALYLELYGDFTRPLEPGLALDPWDLLALLAPRLLDEPSRDDPLWALLARLAGRRRRERPGRNFRPPRAWRTPPSWLEPFDHEGTWRWSAARDTLRLVHPAGFPVLAVPRTQELPRVQLARELRRLRLAPTLRRTTLPPEPVQPLARWTGRLAAYADSRLRRALALGPDDALDALLLRRRARVFVTATHVDVAFRLADLPLEVRFAGLDRTPGWIPAAGRFVAFHFE